LYTFTQRAVEVWNSLPETVVGAATITCFEARLDRFWNSQEQKFNYSEMVKSSEQE